MNTAARNIFLFFIILYSSAAYTQTAWIDSLKKVVTTQKEDTNKVASLMNISDAYRFTAPDSALLYGQQALSLAEKLNSDTYIFWSIVSINGSLYVLGNYALELDYAYKALPLAKKLNNSVAIGYSNGMLSDCYYNLEEYNTALKYWREVVKICEQSSPGERPAVYGNLSRVFVAMHQYDSALIYARKSYELFRESPSFNKDNGDDKRFKSTVFTGLGDAFSGKAYYDSALFYYRMSLPFSGEIHMDPNKVDAYNGIAEVYKERHNFYYLS